MRSSEAAAVIASSVEFDTGSNMVARLLDCTGERCGAVGGVVRLEGAGVLAWVSHPRGLPDGERG